MLGTHNRGVIARGLGRSYGDASLNNGGDVILTADLNAVRSFDVESGVMCCEAGVSFADIMGPCLQHGWLPPVCPGTAFVSMGGAIANDIHGKNQHVAGNFADHVEWFDLLLADGTHARVSRDRDRELFEATVGGIGLTGVITAVQFRLRRIPSNALEMRQTRVPHIDAFLEQLVAGADSHEHVVGWIDGLAKGRHLGRGILEVADTSTTPVPAFSRRELSMPVDLPPWVLNRYSVGLFNAAYFHRVPVAGRVRRIHVSPFLFPLDALHQWNRLYGLAGVYQFQCVVPFDTGRRACIELMEEAVRNQNASFLAVIKSMGKSGMGMLSYAQPGFSLALDFPRRATTRACILRLHEIALKHRGRVFLAKDACLTTEQFAAMYPRARELKAVLERLDPQAAVQSDMSRRLGLR